MTNAPAVSEAKTRPVKVFRAGRLSISVFPNHATVRNQDRVFHSASIQRSYKDADGAYKSTHSLGKDDLPTLQLLIAQAWEFMVNEEAAQRRKAAV